MAKAFPSLVFCVFVCLAGYSSLRSSEPSVPNVLVVLGASGEVDYGDQFREWGKRWKDAFGESITEVIDGTSTSSPFADEKNDRQRTLDWIAKTGAGESDDTRTYWLVLIGHGTNDRTGAKFNLRGPDLSDVEIANALNGTRHRWIIVNCSSSSGPFLSTLSSSNRVVITATKSGAEQNFSRFGSYFSEAILDPATDLDHDSSISVLEAFLSASNRVARFYVDENRLASEQSLLDDNADRKGTPAVFFRGLRPVKAPADGLKLDGSLASQVMIRSLGERKERSADQTLKIEQLQAEVELLRTKKSEMDVDEYYATLEKLLIQLAEYLVD
ncbi:MAG: hypothetical protein ACK56W_06485 [Pirellula sp.]